MTKKELGEIVSVIKENGMAEYKVRLSRSGLVSVRHSQVQPSRFTILQTGSRLLVTHNLGIVESATTELSLTLRGTVISMRRIGLQISYQVELDQGGTIELPKDRILPHPEGRALLPKAIVEIVQDGNVIFSAQPVSEKETTTITRINSAQLTVDVTGSQVGKYTVRLAPEVIRKLKAGDELDLEIVYSPQDKPKYILSPKKFSRQPQKPESQAGKSAFSNTTAPARQSPPDPQSQLARVEAEAFGLDAVMLENVKRAGHRHEIIAFLEKHARDGLIEWYELKPGRSARCQQPAQPLDPVIRQAIVGATPEFSDFFRHQALALDAIRADRNLVIVTQTASGKTLSYNPAIFEYLLGHPNGHVLYIFPLNALMMDQLEKIKQMIKALEGQSVNVRAEFMMGGMTPEARDRAAQNHPNIVVTNPEMLNFMMDRVDRDWREFFAGLKTIVMDEVHSYRGIFGVHMTGIIRRLLILARRCGSNPHFVISSATVHNPLDLASRLTALPENDFVLIDADQDGSNQASKHWLVLNSDWGSKSGKRNNYQEVAADMFVEMLLSRNLSGKPAPLNTILFCRSMKEVVSIKKLVDQRLDQKAPSLKRKVRSYISGVMTIAIKQEIYNGLRSGELIGVISTNALEAGIDIGSLDVCIICGFPFSVMALRQMAGRVGRKKEGLVLYIPFPLSYLDQYYSDHPDLLLTQPPEEFVVDAQNPYIARKHINAASYPVGMSDDELRKYWGDRAAEIVLQASRDGVMHRQGNQWVGSKRPYRDAEDVYQIGNIRSNTQCPYVVCRDDFSKCTVQSSCFDQNKKTCDSRITLMDQQYVYRDCYPGAVYESPDQGIFRVTSLVDEKRVVKVSPLADDCLERTYVETDVEIKFSGQTRGRKTIIPGVDMTWGDVKVTRLFTGYYQYTLTPARRCRKCRKEYDETIDACPNCHRPTERFFNRSKSERKDFPAPYQQGFRILLTTVASWLTIKPDIESSLVSCSPCKLPGEENKVLAWLKKPLNFTRLPANLRISNDEKKWIGEYHQAASEKLHQTRLAANETILYPGIYDQCLLVALRRRVNESRALDLYHAISGYPVTTDLRHICRNCQRSVLLPAMHTLEHAVDARYPSVALGDRSDIGAFTTLGHPDTGLPTIFWFDNYEGGLGASEKIYELILRLIETGLNAIQNCTCTALEGCPRCTFIPDCGDGNAALSKPAGILLISRLLSRDVGQSYDPFVYRKKRAEEFSKAYQENETIAYDHGIGEEAPTSSAPIDPHQLLRLQQIVHAAVVNKAFEIRSREIVEETPPISAEELNIAYQTLLARPTLKEWQSRPNLTPYEILEILPNASLAMIQHIYRVIALQVHPDANPNRTVWANEMMKQLNTAYEQITKEKSDKRR